MKKNRVLIISTTYLPLIGGAEVAIKEITQRLKGYKFDLVCARLRSDLPTYEKMGNINVRRVGFGIKLDKYLLSLFVLLRGLFGPSYSFIWAVMASYGAFALPIVKIVRPRTRFLLTLQEGDSEEHILRKVGVLKPLWLKIFKRADHIQTISNYLRNFAQKHGAVSPVVVIPNGVNVKEFQKSKFKYQIKSKTKNPKPFTIITTSRLVYKNGIDILIRAMTELKSHSLVIVGDGPDRQKLEKLSQELGISSLVEFVGEVSPEKIPAYLASADIFIRPSRSEGLGNSFLEAMGAGLPVIGTEVGGIPDFLTNGETGLFAKVDDPKDLSEKINTLAQDNKLREKIIKNGQKLVLENYSWDNVTNKMSDVFEKLKIKKNILVATGLYPPEIGGPATHTVLMEEYSKNKYLGQRSFVVKVIPFRTVRHLPKVIRHIVYTIKCAAQARVCDLVFAQDILSVGFPAALSSLVTRRPFIVRVPGDYIWEQAVQRWGVRENIDEFQNQRYGPRVEFLRAIQRFVVNRADLVITPSDYFKHLVSKWVRDPNKVKRIYNGIELSKTDYKPHKSFKKTIVSAGRLVSWKGFGMLIEILKDLPDWKLIIVGDGPDMNKLKVKSEMLKVVDRIEFTGNVSREKLLKLLQTAGVFVLNTHFESFSYQTVEAMRESLPVIVTNIGSLPELVVNNVSGILIKPDNKSELLVALSRLEKDEKFRNDISHGAFEGAKDFSIGGNMLKFVEEVSKQLI